MWCDTSMPKLLVDAIESVDGFQTDLLTCLEPLCSELAADPNISATTYEEIERLVYALLWEVTSLNKLLISLLTKDTNAPTQT